MSGAALGLGPGPGNPAPEGPACDVGNPGAEEDGGGAPGVPPGVDCLGGAAMVGHAEDVGGAAGPPGPPGPPFPPPIMGEF